MEGYNWNLILKTAVPIAVIEAVIFYLKIIAFWRWAALIAGMALAGFLVYSKDKRKGDVFTAVAIVFLSVLVMGLLINLKGF